MSSYFFLLPVITCRYLVDFNGSLGEFITCLLKINFMFHFVFFRVCCSTLVRVKCSPVIGLNGSEQNSSLHHYPVSKPPPPPGQSDVDGRGSTFKRTNQSRVKSLQSFNNGWTALGLVHGQLFCNKFAILQSIPEKCIHNLGQKIFLLLYGINTPRIQQILCYNETI